eukprot:1347053-Amorphochlora_amoeboformis.AAC.1
MRSRLRAPEQPLEGPCIKRPRKEKSTVPSSHSSCAEPPIGNPMLKRWALSKFSGSLREAGGVNPLKMARLIRERIASVMQVNVQLALQGDRGAGEVIKQHSNVDLRDLKSSRSRQHHFDKFICDINVRTQKMYDSKEYYPVKWINCLPSFQTRFGVSASRIEPYINAMENIERLKGLYSYFFLLYLDTYCSTTHPETWAKLFPKKAAYVRDNGLSLGKFDAYEEWVV